MREGGKALMGNLPQPSIRPFCTILEFVGINTQPNDSVKADYGGGFHARDS
jgi:hypothetical protein